LYIRRKRRIFEAYFLLKKIFYPYFLNEIYIYSCGGLRNFGGSTMLFEEEEEEEEEEEPEEEEW
jgi:hypothetical protein